MNRFIDKVELIAGLLLGGIALLTFSAVMARWLFNYGIPDAFDFSRLLLGTAMFWGIASAGFRNRHIQVDGLWEMLPRKGKWVIDVIATVITLAFFALFAWMLQTKVVSVYASSEQTFDLRLPVWPFHALAALGILLASILLLLRLIRLIGNRGN
ncbi:TRAP transporter small permease [uncultured Ferrovibrio sp.]|jgi:TRAP-type C4-dicarboxylate transport system permease small subunit|uniref:TRAP transporter small permease n=1 Tax=uncultured Ferrovibrio sp. TaxID=1576913 RepID=UPI00262EFE00|nr:TRAP transporter small permease [uncultured Ferrovibrio sp.]